MDRRILLIIFIIIIGYGRVLSVSQRLQAFENAIEEARPYLRDRRLRREDAYDIERRMLSSAFKKAMGEDILKLDVELEQSLRDSESQHGKDENVSLIQNDDIDEDFDGNPSGSTLKQSDGSEIYNYGQTTNGMDENGQYDDDDNQQNVYNTDNHGVNNFFEQSLSNEHFETNKPSFNYLCKSLKARETDENPDEDDEDNTNLNKAFNVGKITKETVAKTFHPEKSDSLFENLDEDQKLYDSFEQEKSNLLETDDCTDTKTNDLSNSFNYEKESFKKNVDYGTDDNKEESNFWNNDDIDEGENSKTYESPNIDDNGKTDLNYETDRLQSSHSNSLESNIINDMTKNSHITVGNNEYDAAEYNIHDYGAHVFDRYDDLQNMSWTQWLVNHPNIYLYATKNFQVVSNILPKDANRTAIEELVRNSAKLLQAQKDRLTQQDEHDTALKSDRNIMALNTVTSSFNRIGTAAKEFTPIDHSLMNLNKKDQSSLTTVGNNWGHNHESFHHKQNNKIINFNEPDHSDQSDQFQMYGSSMDQSNQHKHYDESTNNLKYHTDSMTKEKRNPNWNNWPITNPATFNFGMKYKKDRSPPTLMVLDPMVLQNLIPEKLTNSEEETSAPLLALNEIPKNKLTTSLQLEQEQNPTNDQIDLNKNDLSHEADYKLSRLEQEQNEADHEHSEQFWSTYNSRESDKNDEHNWQKSEKT